MILVDTSVWIDHLRGGDVRLVRLLEAGRVLVHPFVVGELACGTLASRTALIDTLQDMPQASLADTDEVLRFLEHRGLYGKGIGYVDVHLLASVALTPDAQLWTRDRRLLAVASGLQCAFEASRPH